MRVMINAVGITPEGTIKSGWMTHSATMAKARTLISKWIKEIIKGDYEHQSPMRVEWIKSMISKGYKIEFHIVLHDQGYEVNYNKEA